MDILMMVINMAVLPYLVGVLGSIHAGRLTAKEQKQFQDKLADMLDGINSKNDPESLKAELEKVSLETGKILSKIGYEKKYPGIVKFISDDFYFNDAMEEWLRRPELGAKNQGRSKIESLIEEALKNSGVKKLKKKAVKACFDILEVRLFNSQTLAHKRQDAQHAYMTTLLLQIRQKVGNRNTYSIEERTKVLQQYRQILLKICDIIDLAGLPEDKVIAKKEFVHRQLYIPLRLRLDIELNNEGLIGKNFSDRNIDDEELNFLEKRRRQQRLWAAGRDIEIDEESDSENRHSIGQRLRASKRHIILGDPGSGKTTLLRWLTTAYLLRLKDDAHANVMPDIADLPPKNWLPILIRCRDIKSSLNDSLEDILKVALKQYEFSSTEAEILSSELRSLLQKGKAILLIDGLDEIASSPDRRNFCKKIETFAEKYENAPIIGTSRIVGYRELGFKIRHGFDHLTVLELEKDEKDVFARRWCELTEQELQRKKKAEELIFSLHSSDRIERLTGNPMLLTTLALVKRKIGRLPNKRSKLYYEAISVLLNWRSEVDDPLDEDEALPQLQYVAFEMCNKGVQVLRKDEILELLDKIRVEYPSLRIVKNSDPSDFLSRLEKRTGILMESGNTDHNGRDVPVYEFRHLTFQEYLAALALVQGFYPGYDRSLSLANRIAPLATVIKSYDPVLSQGEEYQFAENWREPMRLLTSICNYSDADEVLMTILTPSEYENKEETLRPRAIMAALCLADEPNLKEETGSEILRKLTYAINITDENYYSTVLYRVARELSNSEWGNTWWKMLAERIYEGVRVEIVEAIMNLCGYMRLLMLKSDKQNIISTLNYTINDLNKPIDIIGILLSLNIYNIPRIRDAIESDEINKEKNSISIINDLSTNENIGLSHAAVAALNTLCDVSSVDYLIVRLKDDYLYVRKMATVALGKIGDERAVEPLIAKFEDVDGGVRAMAAWSLGRIGNERAVEPLIAKLKDVDEEVRLSAAAALGEIGDARAVEPLIAKLEDVDEDEAVKEHAAWALGRIGDARAVEHLIAKLKDVDGDVRSSAASALGKIGDARAVEPLIAKLEDVDEDVRSNVVEALGKIGDERAVEPLIAKLEDIDVGVRLRAADALGKIGDEKALEPLIAKLKDVDGGVRATAAWALGKIGDARSIEHLQKLSENESEEKYVREFAKKSIENIRGKQN